MQEEQKHAHADGRGDEGGEKPSQSPIGQVNNRKFNFKKKLGKSPVVAANAASKKVSVREPQIEEKKGGMHPADIESGPGAPVEEEKKGVIEEEKKDGGERKRTFGVGKMKARHNIKGPGLIAKKKKGIFEEEEQGEDDYPFDNGWKCNIF